ncbi:MAG: adenylosuccinate lyase [Candidatus Levybacteria bacterium]|nr:adenylosuccinate lyase [Candidatus Levybacteria bacterium]
MPAKSLLFVPLTAINPLDGRYRTDIEILSPFISEYALIKTRVEVEALYLFTLSENTVIRPLTGNEKKILTALYEDFSLDDAMRVKQIEDETKHDVKAVERIFREKLHKTSLADCMEMIHFGLTSEDINNLSYRLMLERAMTQVINPAIKEIINHLLTLTQTYKMLPMLARTHGQPAIPTTLGKELVVFADRLTKELIILQKHRLSGKLNGAAGNYNALAVAYPKIDWQEVSNDFVASLGLMPNPVTTQINTYEDIISLFQILQRVNLILLDLDQDMWRYISDLWFVQEVREKEVGSSTMPQKINPIRFENSEGNIGIANALLEFFVRKLPVSRLQRDLSDSTVMRNTGAALAYSLLAYKNTLGGLLRVKPNEEQIRNDLHKDWSILTEAVQTILRKEGVKDSYSLIKSLSRGKHITSSDWMTWVTTLPVKDSIKTTLKKLTPETYIGLAPKIVDQAIKDLENLNKT